MAEDGTVVEVVLMQLWRASDPQSAHPVMILAWNVGTDRIDIVRNQDRLRAATRMQARLNPSGYTILGDPAGAAAKDEVFIGDGDFSIEHAMRAAIIASDADFGPGFY